LRQGEGRVTLVATGRTREGEPVLSRIRSRLSYANVMATIAVFLALGGGAAYAANTVFSTDIVNGQVKTADLANGAATNAKIGANAVNSGKVTPDSLTGADIAEGTLSGIARGSSDAGTFTVASPLEVTVPNLGTFTMSCSDGETPFSENEADDEIGSFVFSNIPAAVYGLTHVSNTRTDTMTHDLAANNGFSFGFLPGPISVTGAATPTGGGPSATFYASGEPLPNSDDCFGVIHVVRSN
jgi:hypothetical protein